MKKIIVTTFVLIFSSILFGQWEKIKFPKSSPYKLLETSKGLIAATTNDIYISRDDGISWDSLSSISPIGISKILQVGDVLLLNTSRGTIWPRMVPSLFRSDDFGKTWYSVHDAVNGGSSISFFNSKIYADLDGKLYSSIDTGKTWNLLNTSSFFPNQIAEVLSDGYSLYVRINSKALYRSDDNASTWDSLKINFPNHFYEVLVQDSCIYVGTYSDGFYISKNRGNSWQDASMGLPDSVGFMALHLMGNYIIASISKNFQQSIYIYNLKENKWHIFNEGFSIKVGRLIYDFANNAEYIFLATDSSIWRRPVSDLITDIHNSNYSLINNIVLYQNYPNPFNPVTIIKFSISNSDLVQIQIMNILGQVVAVSYKNKVSPGTYEVKFNGSNLPSGIYFYRLETSSFSKTKKLLLIK
ncbi:MAG: T9SS type A sorting domain-containing protein [Ignavibacteriaceae bacterium]